jgi:hypothetical protein
VVFYKRTLSGGRQQQIIEPLGNVFRPIPGETSSPVWSFADPTSADAKGSTALFTCPVSAVPEDVWKLFMLWNECRLMGLPPKGGGFLDQPLAVQKAFPVFQHEFNAYRRRSGDSGSERTATMVATMMLAGIFGTKG